MAGILLSANDHGRPQERRPPYCIFKVGTRVGCFDPILNMCWGIQVRNQVDARPLLEALQGDALWDIDTYVLSDDAAFIPWIMKATNRLNIMDYMQGDRFESGVPLLLLPQMAAAMQAAEMLKQMELNQKLLDARTGS